MLGFPSKAANSCTAVAFQDGNLWRQATHFFWLCVPDGSEGAIGNAFDVTVAQKVGGEAESSGFVEIIHMLDDLGICRTRLNERAAKRFEEIVILGVTCALFGYLARTPGDNVLVALPAALSVIDRTKTLIYAFGFFKNESGIVERGEGIHVVFIDGFKVRSLTSEAVGSAVKTGAGFARSIRDLDLAGNAFYVKIACRTFRRSWPARSESLLAGLGAGFDLRLRL